MKNQPISIKLCFMVKVRLNYLLLFLVGEMFLISSCAPKKTVLPSTEYNQGYHAAEKDYLASQKIMADYIDQLEKELALKTEKLRLFNLVDESGKLRSTEQRQPKPVTGAEKWQK